MNVPFAEILPHKGGPCAEGPITGTTDASFNRETLELTVEYTKEGMILNCPWHSWEYDLTTGECLSRNNRDLPTYPVRTDNNQIIISI